MVERAFLNKNIGFIEQFERLPMAVDVATRELSNTGHIVGPLKMIRTTMSNQCEQHFCEEAPARLTQHGKTQAMVDLGCGAENSDDMQSGWSRFCKRLYAEKSLVLFGRGSEVYYYQKGEIEFILRHCVVIVLLSSAGPSRGWDGWPADRTEYGGRFSQKPNFFP
jgi:hypothetical protein